MFFGKNVLQEQAKRKWGCVTDLRYANFTGFCARALTYPFSLPQPEKEAVLTSEAMKEQGREAIKMYTAHLAGMGYEYWEYPEPWNIKDSNKDCIQSVWKLVCYTYFPRCNERDESKYLKPCMNGCEIYKKACAVQCCDEGVQCVFNHETKLSDGTVMKEEGYSDHIGPSTFCTGAACFFRTSALTALLSSIALIGAFDG
jgi:hypothetical protein